MSLTLDHFVMHIDDRPDLLDRLKTDLASLDIPFEPDWGKGTKGFKAANVWIGRQYFEIVRILKPDGGGWVKRWVERHHRGKRGLYCLFLATDDIDATAARLRAEGLAVEGPERITFRALFGLLKKSMPWRVLYLPPLPGTEVEIGFIDYDPDPTDRMKGFMVPNADENGIPGVTAARMCLPLSTETRACLHRIFPQAETEDKDGADSGPSIGRITVPLDGGQLRFEHAAEIHTDLYAPRSGVGPTGAIHLENVTLHV